LYTHADDADVDADADADGFNEEVDVEEDAILVGKTLLLQVLLRVIGLMLLVTQTRRHEIRTWNAVLDT
jgi:hypothetical protein